MPVNKFYNNLHIDKSVVHTVGFNPYYVTIESGMDDPLIINGEGYINLAANNYLGLATDQRVKESMIRAVRKYGASLCGTPIATGYADIVQATEQRLAAWLGLEAAILFPSCYQANAALFQAITTRDDLLIIDHYAHASLVDGCRASGCKIRPFLHNDLNSLEGVLKKAVGCRQVFVVTESVFSTEGAIAPYKDIVVLCDRYNAIPVIDDSHGIGVLGARGKGILEQQGISAYAGIYTASLGKALANIGGVIAGKVELIDYLKYSCRGLIYSTAIIPAALAGINAVLDIVEQEFATISSRMWDYKQRINQSLIACGFAIANGEAPINAIIGGSDENTLRIAKELFVNKILTTPFIPPSVPTSKGVVRIIAGANLEEKSIQTSLDVIKKIAGTVL